VLRMRIALRAIAIAGAAMVLGSLFLHWSGTEIVVAGLPGGTLTESGWAALHERDIALAGISGAAIVLGILSFLMPHRAVMAAIAVLGTAALGLTVVDIVSPPVAHTATQLEIRTGHAIQAAASADVGPYLALAGSTILAVAGMAGALTAGTKYA
jgi:hypothetical protein